MKINLKKNGLVIAILSSILLVFFSVFYIIPNWLDGHYKYSEFGKVKTFRAHDVKEEFEVAYSDNFNSDYITSMNNFKNFSEKNGYDLSDAILRLDSAPDKNTLVVTYIFNFENRTTWQWLYFNFSGYDLTLKSIETYGEGSLGNIQESYDVFNELIKNDDGWSYTFSDASSFYELLSKRNNMSLNEIEKTLE